MNKFEAERRFAQHMKNNYPPGTRIMLLQMGDDPRPIEPNTRGTVKAVDDIGTLHCNFDNGRSLGIVPGEDSFRKLTDEELEEEQEMTESEDFGMKMQQEEQNMPNHVINHISLQGDSEKIRSMLEAIKSDELGVGSVDFNKIIPMPKCLDIEAGSRTNKGLDFYKGFIEVYTLGGTMNMDKLRNIPVKSEEIFLRQRKDIPRDEWELGKAAWQNIRDFGTPTWYEWCNKNWGTKWNAYGYDKSRDDSSGNNIWFQSAWDAPHPVIEKLAARYPEITFEHEWADEDIGQNCGRRSYQNGEIIDGYVPENQKEAV